MGPPIHLLSGPNVLTGTPPCVHLLRGSASSLAHCSVSDSDTICNCLNPSIADIVLFGLCLKVSKTCLLKRSFHTLIKKKKIRSPPQLMWDLTIQLPSEPSDLTDIRSLLLSIWDPAIHVSLEPNVLAGTPHVHSLRDSAFSLTHRLVSISDTICNGISPLIVDIILFGLSLKDFKTCLLKRDFHTLIKKVSFSPQSMCYLTR